jgi:serine/threonine-protein kinase
MNDTLCSNHERLTALLDGKIADAEQADLQTHIDSCESCQRTLEELVAGKESWDGIARRLGDQGAPVTPGLQDVMAEAIGATASDGAGHSVRLPPGFLQPAQQPDSMGRLAHYEVLQEVGSGGMGIVLKAFDTSLRRVVAIKVMAPHLASNAAARRRFVREAQAAAAVAHEHVVAIHAVADQHDPPYLAMQFIEGKTLQERLDKSGPLSVREVLRIGMQTAAGLAAAHAQGLVHRDIKPANILLENGVERVKLTDFGLARAVDDASMTQSGVIAGTPLFMSPEQARGESIDHRSDLFSLGSVLYAMCVGHAPFRASTTMGVIKRVCDESPRPIRELNPDVPDWLVNIINKLLAKKPSDRFQSAKDVSELLGQCLAHLEQPQSVPAPREMGHATVPPPTAQAARPAVAETNSVIRWLTLAAIGLWGLFLILRLLHQVTWQSFLIATYYLGGWLLFMKVVGWLLADRNRILAESRSGTPSNCSTSRTEGWRLRCTKCGKTRSLASVGGVRIGAASKGKFTLGWCSVCRAFRSVAVEWGEIDPNEPPLPRAFTMRRRIAFVTGLVGGILTIAMIVQRTSRPIPGMIGAWFEHACEAALFLMAMLFLLAGVFAGWHHGFREQPRTGGSMLRGLSFAAICLTLLLFLTDNLAGRWKGWQRECSIRFEVTRPEDSDLHFQLIPTLIQARRVFHLPDNESLPRIPANGEITKLPAGDYHLRVLRGHQTIYSERLTLFPGQWFVWPLVPASLETFAKLQGRWEIVSAKGNIAAPLESDYPSPWWIELNEDRFLASDLARSGVLKADNLHFGIGPTSALQCFDLIGHARGTFRFDGDTLHIGLANPGEPRILTSDPAAAATHLVCRRFGSEVADQREPRPAGQKASLAADSAIEPTSVTRTSDSESPQPIAKLLLDDAGAWNLAVSSDGKRFAAIGPNGGGGGSKVRIWETATLDEAAMFTVEREVHDLVFLPDLDGEEQRIATVEADHRVRVRNLVNGEVIRESEPFIDPMFSLAVADNGKTLVFAGADLLVRLWDVKSGQVRKVISGATSTIHSVAASADGNCIAAGSQNGHVWIWNVKTTERLHLWTHLDLKVTSVAFSPDSQRLAAASWNRLACVFDLGSDYPTKFLKAHTDHVRTIAWSPDGQRVATASSDGSAIVWDAATAKRLAVFDAKANQCFDVVFLNEFRIATAHRDGFVRVWDTLKPPAPPQ